MKYEKQATSAYLTVQYTYRNYINLKKNASFRSNKQNFTEKEKKAMIHQRCIVRWTTNMSSCPHSNSIFSFYLKKAKQVNSDQAPYGPGTGKKENIHSIQSRV